MSKSRLLIVEDDIDISNMLRIYFTSQQYDVEIASHGNDALDKTRQTLPHLILLDIMLPDIDGFEVCRNLRTNPRSSHVPIIFLTQKDERSDKLQGFELGADDYITKPFDIEELMLRVKRAITRAEQLSLTDPRSGLPSGRLIAEQLRLIIRHKDWALIDIRLNHYQAFREIYGFVAGDDVLRFTALLVGEVVDELGTPNDFIGHAQGNNFIIISAEDAAAEISRVTKQRFEREVLPFYNFIDRKQGYLTTVDESGKQTEIPFMTLSIGTVSQSEYQFTDIREITELAAEARRRDN